MKKAEVDDVLRQNAKNYQYFYKPSPSPHALKGKNLVKKR
jgi:hypothetical protein